MSRKRIFTDERCKELAEWFDTFERVGTFKQKAEECDCDEETLRDAIRRGRGEITRPLRRKLSDAEINQLATDISRGTP